MFLLSLLLPLIYLMAGVVQLRFPPQNINTWYGYRTKRSMSEPELWTRAQRFSSLRMMESGAITALLGLLWMAWLPDEINLVILILIQTLATPIWVGLRTEKQLRSVSKN